jgi:Asp-tRNA(Asn)/Glu-tRNA(Gln) amidotransferase A subunit family amidase
MLLLLMVLSSIEDAGGATLRAPSANVLEKSILELQDAMAGGALTSRQLVDIYLARIAAYDKQGPALNAITTVNPEARRIADALDAERRATGPRGPLHGIPILLKDNYETVEMPTSAGSIALATFHPKSDAFLVKKLRDAGAVILGKTNMHELAAGILTVGSRFGQTRNPYDLDRNPGGSSGGTGAAVAANFATAGMGSDTCGSIRIPAANNNLVGLRGTQGLSSRSGIVPLSATQDIGGPLARSVTDLAILLDATVGADPADPVTMQHDDKRRGTFREALRADALTGARIGVLRASFGSAPEDGEVTTIVNKTLEALSKAGAKTIDVVIPGLEELLRDSTLITWEFKFDFADYLAKHPDAPVTSLGEVIDRGLYHAALETTFRRRNAVEKRGSDDERRTRIKQRAIREAAIAAIDEHQLSALIYPTLRRRPARIGDAQAGTNCFLSSHSGLPALAVPAGWTDDGLPVGVDLLGPPWSDVELVSLGYAMEQTLKLRRAPFSTPALVGGKPPAQQKFSVALNDGTDQLGSTEFVYDRTTGRLSYTTRLAASAERVIGVWIHRLGADKPAAAVHMLHGDRSPAAGTVVLTGNDRADFAAGRLILRIYTKANPRGSEVKLAALSD